MYTCTGVHTFVPTRKIACCTVHLRHMFRVSRLCDFRTFRFYQCCVYQLRHRRHYRKISTASAVLTYFINRYALLLFHLMFPPGKTGSAEGSRSMYVHTYVMYRCVNRYVCMYVGGCVIFSNVSQLDTYTTVFKQRRTLYGKIGQVCYVPTNLVASP
jgi:hypothetical protein